jgi:hypothetical protein
MSDTNKNKTTILVPARICASPQSEYKATASSSFPELEAQPDLLYMRSVLVSTGSNKNDDVFLPEEMWDARFSPTLKFVNWEHNSGREATADELAANPNRVVIGNQIIGVMYNSFVTDENGVIINEEKAEASDFEIPERFDIVDEAVIYKGVYPKVAARIEVGAAKGNLFVSMEAYFGNYDYLVGNKVVARNEQTAFLENKLRANGGDGTFGADRVRRVLRKIVFGGKGIVERPANEPSVIKSVTHKPITANASTNKAIASNVIGDLGNTEESINMSENAKKLMDAATGPSFEDYKVVAQELAETRVELKAKASELDSTKTELEEAKANQEHLKSALAKGGVALEDTLPGISEKLSKAGVDQLFDVIAEDVGAVKTAADEKVKAAETRADSAQAELAVLTNTVRASERLSKVQTELSLAAVEGDDEETVSEKLAQATKIADATKELDDEAFASTLEDYKSLLVVAKKGFVPFGKDKDKKDKEGDDKKEDKAGMKNKGGKKTLADEGITDETVLDSITTKASMSAGTDNSGDNQVLNLEKAYAGLVTDLIGSRKNKDNKDN